MTNGQWSQQRNYVRVVRKLEEKIIHDLVYWINMQRYGDVVLAIRQNSTNPTLTQARHFLSRDTETVSWQTILVYKTSKNIGCCTSRTSIRQNCDWGTSRKHDVNVKDRLTCLAWVKTSIMLFFFWWKNTDCIKRLDWPDSAMQKYYRMI